jgi:predicted nucleotidyltransferase
MNTREMAEQNCVYKIRSGSHLYGTNTEESDLDYLGIFVPTRDYVLGIYRCEQVVFSEKNSPGTKNTKEDIDCTLFSLLKFIELARNNNPNIIELFFANHTAVTLCTDLGGILQDSYKLFVSKQCYHRFKGYAAGQRQKMLSNNGKGRDVTRKDLVEKYGFDCKYGSHLIRLLLEGLELLTEGKLTLPLTQNVLVRDIKIGKYTMNEVMKKAEELERLVDLAYVNSPLQVSSDIDKINDLQIYLLKDFWRTNEKN